MIPQCADEWLEGAVSLGESRGGGNRFMRKTARVRVENHDSPGQGDFTRLQCDDTVLFSTSSMYVCVCLCVFIYIYISLSVVKGTWLDL